MNPFHQKEVFFNNNKMKDFLSVTETQEAFYFLVGENMDCD